MVYGSPICRFQPKADFNIVFHNQDNYFPTQKTFTHFSIQHPSLQVPRFYIPNVSNQLCTFASLIRAFNFFQLHEKQVNIK